MGEKIYIADKETLDKVYNILASDPVFGFIEHNSILSPGSRIEYIGLNKDYAPLVRNKTNGSMTLNSWADFPLIAEISNCRFLRCRVLRVVRLHTGKAYHPRRGSVRAQNGTVVHGKPYALQLLIVRVNEAHRLVPVAGGKGKAHDPVVAYHFFVLINLHKPRKGAAVVVAVCNVGSSAALALGVVCFLKSVVAENGNY